MRTVFAAVLRFVRTVPKPLRARVRLESGSRHGDVLITISTGPMTEDEEERFGLVETHAYAVLDVREISGLKLLQVLVAVSRCACCVVLCGSSRSLLVLAAMVEVRLCAVSIHRAAVTLRAPSRAAVSVPREQRR